MGDFAYYVHIMLIGRTTENVELACADKEFSPKRRVYLIHSPNQKKSATISAPINFETIAKKTKKWIITSKHCKNVLTLAKGGCRGENLVEVSGIEPPTSTLRT